MWCRMQFLTSSRLQYCYTMCFANEGKNGKVQSFYLIKLCCCWLALWLQLLFCFVFYFYIYNDSIDQL